MTLEELKRRIRYEITKARARQSDAEERGDEAMAKRNRTYARKCQMALEIIEDIEKANQ